MIASFFAAGIFESRRILRCLSFLFIYALLSAPAFAQTQSFDLFTFDPPAAKEGSLRGGLAFLAGSTVIPQGRSSGALDLFVLSASGRVTSLVVMATNLVELERQQSVIGAFLGSLRLANRAVREPASPEPSAGPAAPAASAQGITGVWMGFPLILPVPSGGPVPRWITFFDNGEVFTDIPRTGFLGFDRGASQADEHQTSYWGNYTYGNGSGQYSKPGVRAAFKIQAAKPGVIKVDSNEYYRYPPVDGLRLEGEWTSLANPHDPDLDRWEVGQLPLFRFTRDGHFTDEGVFMTIMQGYNEAERRTASPGSGTCEIRDYTLILRYSDGRVKQVAITGLLGANPAEKNNMIFLGRTRFTKR